MAIHPFAYLRTHVGFLSRPPSPSSAPRGSAVADKTPPSCRQKPRWRILRLHAWTRPVRIATLKRFPGVLILQRYLEVPLYGIFTGTFLQGGLLTALHFCRGSLPSIGLLFPLEPHRTLSGGHSSPWDSGSHTTLGTLGKTQPPACTCVRTDRASMLANRGF